MKGRITRNYCYLNEKVVDMWYIQGIPFTFDELPEPMAIEEIQQEAASNQSYTMDDMYRYSQYLIAEACHPLLFPIEQFVENMEEVPE
tara:strand:+ start:483 stop:746 length:264 start_codon:yes stop_codon:yes gene_type:complete